MPVQAGEVRPWPRQLRSAILARLAPPYEFVHGRGGLPRQVGCRISSIHLEQTEQKESGIRAGSDPGTVPFRRFMYMGEDDKSARPEVWPTILKQAERLCNVALFNPAGVITERGLEPEVFYRDMVIAYTHGSPWRTGRDPGPGGSDGRKSKLPVGDRGVNYLWLRGQAMAESDIH